MTIKNQKWLYLTILGNEIFYFFLIIWGSYVYVNNPSYPESISYIVYTGLLIIGIINFIIPIVAIIFIILFLPIFMII